MLSSLVTCKKTYFFIAIGILYTLSAILWIVSSSMELTTDSSEEDRKSKNSINMAANILFLIGGVVLVFKGNCMRIVEDMSAAGAGAITGSPVLPTY